MTATTWRGLAVGDTIAILGGPQTITGITVHAPHIPAWRGHALIEWADLTVRHHDTHGTTATLTLHVGTDGRPVMRRYDWRGEAWTHDELPVEIVRRHIPALTQLALFGGTT